MKNLSFAPKRRIVGFFGFFLAGLLLGGYLFHDLQPRSVLAIHRCEKCWRPNQLLGLAGAALMTKMPELLTPYIVLETDYTLAIQHPLSHEGHFVIIPKKDIPHLGTLSEEDKPYLIDALAVIHELINKNGFDYYRVWTNGSGHQTVNHLHFHLAESKNPYLAEQVGP